MTKSRELIASALLLLLAVLVGLLLGTVASRAQTPITFAEWIAGFALSSENSQPLADPDGDGLVNLLEFAIAGRNPTVSDANFPQRVLFGQRTGNALPSADPSVITEISPAAALPLQHFHMGYEWSPRPNITGLLFLPEYGRTDSGLYKWWSGRNAVVVRPNPTDSTKLQAWALSLQPRQTFGRAFWRLRVKLLDPPPAP